MFEDPEERVATDSSFNNFHVAGVVGKKSTEMCCQVGMRNRL